MNKRASLLFSIIAWLVAVGLVMLLRFYGTAETVDWMLNNTVALLVWLLVGSVLGVFYWLADLAGESSRLRRRSYGFLILFKSGILILSFIVLLFITRLIAYMGGVISAADIVPTFFEFLFRKSQLSIFLYLIVVSFIVGFIRQMISKTGPRVTLNLLLGRYRNPREETRVFMFIDLKSSTTHAEKLGHILYSKLIRDCFFDLTDSAIKHQVEIYQYVGDEAVLTWTQENGLKENHCVHAYFDFQETLDQRSDYYQQEYGLMPEFKAGVNSGPVVVTEVGVIKREIAYHSDVLNTAARIQSKCNEFGEHLLISARTKALLLSDKTLSFKSVGEIALRGKEETVELIAITRSVDPKSTTGV